MSRYWLALRGGAQWISKWSQLHGTLCMIPPHNSNQYRLIWGLWARLYRDHESKVKVKLYRYRHAGIKGERRYSSHSFFTSALDGDGWSTSRHGRSLPRKSTPGTRWVGVWMGLRAGLDVEARGKLICLCQRSNPGRPVCSQTLYWLSYPSLLLPWIKWIIGRG
jgi:hypothetical protein